MCQSEYLTVAAAAAALDTTPTAILMLLRRGELVGRVVAEGWEIERNGMDLLRMARQGGVPLVTCRSSCAEKKGGCASCGTDAE